MRLFKLLLSVRCSTLFQVKLVKYVGDLGRVGLMLGGGLLAIIDYGLYNDINPAAADKH